MGVMVPCEKILERARAEKADLIGLSGLITPSLDEMVHVAREMERQGFKLPLLIGGATTSKAHTAVKIAPALQRAGRARARREPRRAGDDQPAQRRRQGGVRRAAPRRVRDAAPASTARPSTSWCRSRRRARNRTPIEWRAEDLPAPEFTGVRVLDDFPLATLREFIDWTPFFHTWELKGVYPRILEHEKYGEQARADLRRGQRAARHDHRREAAHGARRVRPLPGQRRRRRRRALHRRDAHAACSTRFHFLRQQTPEGQRASRTARLADFIAPKETRPARSPRRLRRDHRHRPEGAVRRVPGRSTTTTTPSWPRRSPIAWPRRSPSACTSACATSGATARSEDLTQRRS